MKSVFFGIIFFGIFSVTAIADEPESNSSFHFLTFHCAPEEADGPDATPQSPPLDVDDPGTPGCNAWEVNITADGDIAHSQQSWELPLLDINYGIGDNLQLKFEVPYVNQKKENELAASAIGENKLGVKYMFFDSEKLKMQAAAYPQLTFVNSNSAAVKRNIASPGTITTLPFLVSKTIGKVSNGDMNMTANLGYNISGKEDARDFINMAVGLGAPVSHRLALMGEISSEQAIGVNSDDVRDQLLKVNIGVMEKISKKVIFYASAGHSLYSSDHEAHSYGLIGIQLLTGVSASQNESKAALDPATTIGATNIR